jgi:hypothetical protein
MQVIIDEVVSRIRTMDGGAGISAETLRSIVSAVVTAVEQQQKHQENVDEEHSLRNYQQRNQPWTR